MRKIKRYVSFIPENGNPLKDEVLFVDKKPPDTPHYLIEIRVLGHERAYIFDRPLPPFPNRLKLAFKDALKAFKGRM